MCRTTTKSSDLLEGVRGAHAVRTRRLPLTDARLSQSATHTPAPAACRRETRGGGTSASSRERGRQRLPWRREAACGRPGPAHCRRFIGPAQSHSVRKTKPTQSNSSSVQKQHNIYLTSLYIYIYIYNFLLHCRLCRVLYISIYNDLK